MITKIVVALDERAVVYRNGLPVRALGPGSHHIWGFGLVVERKSMRTLAFDALPEVRAMLPDAWYREVTIAPNERGVLFRRGRPVEFLRPGTHLYWLADASVALETYALDAPMPKLTDELVAVLPRSAYVLADVPAHAKGLLFVSERFVRVLAPGRVALWTHPDAVVTVKTVDVRRQQVTLAAQELMTKDKVTLRLTLTAEYMIADVVKATLEVVDARDALYVAVQLAARDYVASVTLDALLEGRDAMTRFLEAQVMPKMHALGVSLDAIGVKDVVLPGEMKVLLNRVIEAEKAAAANVILRREEAAATRLRASSARIMAEQPGLMRLTELEAIKEMAKSVGEVRVIVGTEGIERVLGARGLERVLD